MKILSRLSWHESVYHSALTEEVSGYEKVGGRSELWNRDSALGVAEWWSFFEPFCMSCLFTFQPGPILRPYLLCSPPHTCCSRPSSLTSSSSFTTLVLSSVAAGPGISSRFFFIFIFFFTTACDSSNRTKFFLQDPPPHHTVLEHFS